MKEETIRSLVSDLSTRMIHSDAHLDNDTDSQEKKKVVRPIAPAISVTTTFDLRKYGDDHLNMTDRLVYSRETTSTRLALEKTLGEIELITETQVVDDALAQKLPVKAVTYASGLAACHAAIHFFKPKRVIISGGYHGTHQVLDEMTAWEVVQVLSIPPTLSFEAELMKIAFQEGDLIWIETPRNADMDVLNLVAIKEHVLQLVPNRTVHICVDGTFTPPPLQNLLSLQCDRFDVPCVDMAMYSGTKFFGGHSDALLGILMVRQEEARRQLLSQRAHFGATPGSLEAWLVLRSMRTYTLRLEKQSSNGFFLATMLFLLSKKRSSLSSLEVESQKLLSSLDGMQCGATLKGFFQAHLSTFLSSWRTHVPASESEQLFQCIQKHISAVYYPSLLLIKTTGDNTARVDHVWLKTQMSGGFGAIFSVEYSSSSAARVFTKKTRIWRNATSLGGVESLVDYRGLWDARASNRLVRFSTGIEFANDLLLDIVLSIKKTEQEHIIPSNY